MYSYSITGPARKIASYSVDGLRFIKTGSVYVSQDAILDDKPISLSFKTLREAATYMRHYNERRLRVRLYGEVRE